MSKHTPGPWRAYCRDIGYVEGTEWPEDEFLQWEVEGPADPIGRGSFFQGDARLIAAAPELLEAAKLVIAWYEAEDDHKKADFYERMAMCREAEAALRSAIVKATGEA